MKWRDFVTSNKLAGAHVIASKALKDDLTTFVWGARDVFSLPNVIFFDKSHNLVTKSVRDLSNLDSEFPCIISCSVLEIPILTATFLDPGIVVFKAECFLSLAVMCRQNAHKLRIRYKVDRAMLARSAT